MLRAICTSQLHLPDLVCSRTVRILPAMMLSNSVQFSRTCQPTALRSSRSIVLHSSNRKGSIALKAALVETVGFDTVGRLTWDAAALPGADNAEILEGYTLRPNQVRCIWLQARRARKSGLSERFLQLCTCCCRSSSASRSRSGSGWLHCIDEAKDSPWAAAAGLVNRSRGCPVHRQLSVKGVEP